MEEEVDELISESTYSDHALEFLTVFLILSLYSAFFIVLFHYAMKERRNAKARYLEETSAKKLDEDALSSWGNEEEANSTKKFVEGEVVISPNLGRGKVVLKHQTPPEGHLVVDFDILNQLRTVPIKDLLFVGMRLKHGKRGLGSIDMFDFIEERAHVQFDSGEYHRYLLNSWKSKMVPHERYARKQQSFGRFFQDYLLYRIDYVLSNFTFAKPGLLSIMSLTLIILGSTAFALASGTKLSESTWIAWTLVSVCFFTKISSSPFYKGCQFRVASGRARGRTNSRHCCSIDDWRNARLCIGDWVDGGRRRIAPRRPQARPCPRHPDGSHVDLGLVR
jgi:hypothetical protein